MIAECLANHILPAGKIGTLAKRDRFAAPLAIIAVLDFLTALAGLSPLRRIGQVASPKFLPAGPARSRSNFNHAMLSANEGLPIPS